MVDAIKEVETSEKKIPKEINKIIKKNKNLSISFHQLYKEKFISYFKNISSLTTIDIPNQPNAISGIELKKKFKDISNVDYKESIEKAIKAVPIKDSEILIITGSLYLCGEFLNLN